jgi:hypothetical protein
MADVYGANATLRDNQEPTAKIDVNSNFGRMRVAYDSYTFSGDAGFTAGDKIFLMKLPKGARVYDVEMVCGILDTTAAAINVGWAASEVSGEVADEDGFLAAFDTVAALDANLGGTLAGKFKEFSEEVQVEVTLTVAPDSEDTEVFQMAVYYVID